MSERVIYTKLKNADLACMSAKTAIEQYLQFDKLADLQRYTKWTLEGDLDEATLDSILENSYYLANPNKESAITGELPAHAKWTQYHAEVRPSASRQNSGADSDTALNEVGEEDVRRKINDTFGTSIKSVSKSTLWCLFVDEAPSDALQKELEEQVVRTSSQSKGLLANPLYEEVTFRHYSA